MVAANWANLAGAQTQHPIWSARWGHAAVVVNETSPRLIGQSNVTTSTAPKLIVLGGDDYDLYLYRGNVHDEGESTGGGLRNDIWITDPSDLQRTIQSLGRVGSGGYLRGSSAADMAHSNLELHWKEINPGQTSPAIGKENEMWSPRRGHGAVVANNALYVIGGRSRERTRIEDARMVGGVQDRRVETLRDHATTREEVILKNDIWVSDDGLGEKWRLVTPGCKDPQQDVLLNTELWSELGRNNGDDASPQQHNVGSIGSKCTKSSDCYGAAECKALADNTSDDKVCVCNMFGIREHHSVSVQQRPFTDRSGKVHVQDYIFVVGGFTHVRRSFCGDHSCGNTGYRVALDDAWVSADGGLNWIQIKPAFDTKHSFQGRGGHSAIVIHSNIFNRQALGLNDRLVILGGETSNLKESNTTHLNDIWSIALSIEPCCKKPGACTLSPQMMAHNNGCLPSIADWSQQRNAAWAGRSGHATIYEPPSAHNSFTEHVYLTGGMNGSGILSDVWSWNISFDESAPIPWLKDYDGPSLQHGPYSNYLSIDSELSALISYRLPLLPHDEKRGGDIIKASKSMSTSPLVKDQDIGRMNSLGITTIQHLADANVYDMLKLRGIDNPWLEKLPTVHNICYLRSLADAFVRKCSPNKHQQQQQKQQQQQSPSSNYANADPSKRNSTYCTVKLPSSECYLQDWDGCTPIDNFNQVDVYGLGNIPVPKIKNDPSLDLGELHCRMFPKGRYMAPGVHVDNKAIILGGRGQTLHTLHQDAWARDDRFPLAVMATKPRSYSAETRFKFSSNEPTAQEFEYKLFDTDKGIEMTPWQRTTTDKGADVSWLDYRNDGPGKGYYTMYVRAIDLSGNRDISYGETNVYTWFYKPKPPISKILAGVVCTLVSLCVLIFEYRRRQRKAALERYALRRMRRKYRLQQAMKDEENNETNGESAYQWQRLIQDEDVEDNGWDRSGSRRERPSREKTVRSSREADDGGADEYSRRRRKRRRHTSVDKRSRSKSLDHRGKISSRERERARRKRKSRRRREASATSSSRSTEAGASKKYR